MTDLKDLSEQLASYIADAEKLERVIESFRKLEREIERNGDSVPVYCDAFKNLKAWIDNG